MIRELRANIRPGNGEVDQSRSTKFGRREARWAKHVDKLHANVMHSVMRVTASDRADARARRELQDEVFHQMMREKYRR